MTDWVITVPKTVRWEDYKKELDAVENGEVMNFRVRGFPKEMQIGDRCYTLWNGRVRGWMEIVGLVKYEDYWECSTTGRRWAPGNYIQRAGPFIEVYGPAMKGFRGVRKFVGV